jgi:hypothetical protein
MRPSRSFSEVCSCKLKCKEERQSEGDTLLFFTCMMRDHMLIGCVIARHISVIVITNYYVTDLTIPLELKVKLIGLRLCRNNNNEPLHIFIEILF